MVLFERCCIPLLVGATGKRNLGGIFQTGGCVTVWLQRGVTNDSVSLPSLEVNFRLRRPALTSQHVKQIEGDTLATAVN